MEKYTKLKAYKTQTVKNITETTIDKTNDKTIHWKQQTNNYLEN